MATAPASITRSKLTAHQYNNPSSYAPNIYFPTNDAGHIVSHVSREEIPIETSISFQQCSCKLAGPTKELKQWIRSGHSTCMICRNPLKTSDIFTISEKISEFIIKGSIISAIILPILATTIDFKNLSVPQVVIIGQIVYLANHLAKGVVAKAEETGINLQILLKTAKVMTAVTLANMTGIYSGNFVNTGLNHYISTKYIYTSLISKYIYKLGIWYASILIYNRVRKGTMDINIAIIGTLSNFFNNTFFRRTT